jgi:hypothetical protein
MSPGIRVRHGKLCPTRSGGRCTCKPTYQPNVWSAREGKRLFKTLPTLAEANSWRAEAQVALRQGTLLAQLVGDVREAAERWLEGARSGQSHRPKRPTTAWPPYRREPCALTTCTSSGPCDDLPPPADARRG